MKSALLALLVGCLATQIAGEPWTTLRATWGPTADTGYFRMPRTAIDAVNEGWVPLSSSCENDGLYSGFRFTRNNETAVNLIFDKNGIIAGMQALLPHDELMTGGNVYRYDLVTMYQNETVDGRDYVVLTAYFVPPESICTTGRTVFDLIEQGTGTGVWFQNGESPNTQITVPLNRADAAPLGWTDCECFPQMGRHNFFQVESWEATGCDRAQPTQLIYNLKDELHGFVFHTMGRASSTRFENPPNAALVAIVGASRIPQCVLDTNTAYGLSPLHVYFIEEPWNITC